jgi:hypothetical protein
MPLTTPVTEFTDATPGLLLLQLPARIVSLNVVVLPTQSNVVPVTGEMAFTETEIVTVHPEGLV